MKDFFWKNSIHNWCKMCLTPPTYDKLIHLKYLAKMGQLHLTDLMGKFDELTDEEWYATGDYTYDVGQAKENYDAMKMIRDVFSSGREITASAKEMDKVIEKVANLLDVAQKKFTRIQNGTYNKFHEWRRREEQKERQLEKLIKSLNCTPKIEAEIRSLIEIGNFDRAIKLASSWEACGRALSLSREEEEEDEEDEEEEEEVGVLHCKINGNDYLIDPSTRDLYDYNLWMDTGDGEEVGQAAEGVRIYYPDTDRWEKVGDNGLIE